MRSLRPDLHVLAGAYAVDGITDEAERARFERHLRRCQQCADEVRGMTVTATRLGFAAAQPAPPQMRDRVLAAASRTRQLPPAADHIRVTSQAVPRRAPWLAWTVAAAVLVVSIGLTTALLRTQSQLNQARSHDKEVAAVLAARDARAVTEATSVGGRATVVYSLEKHALIVTAVRLPPPPPGKVYQLWLLGPVRIHPMGLLPASVHGRTPSVVLFGLVSGDQLGLTVEPAGGSSRPTTTPIVAVPLRA